MTRVNCCSCSKRDLCEVAAATDEKGLRREVCPFYEPGPCVCEETEGAE